jgi:hypothetical protein
LRRVLQAADAVFTSTASQAGHLQQLSPRTKVRLLPVGSNIRRTSAIPQEREPGLTVLFGLQPSRIKALETGLDELRKLATRGIITRLVSIGAGTTDARERQILDSLPLTGGAKMTGPLNEEEISSWLSRASFGLSAQDELSATKSGTLMAYAAHELNVLSVSSNPPRYSITPAELLGGIPAEELHARATAARDWQEENCSWTHIAEQFARALQLDFGSVSPAR